MFKNLRVENQFSIKILTQAILRNIIFRWAKTSGNQHQISIFFSFSKCFHNMFMIIVNRSYLIYFNAV